MKLKKLISFMICCAVLIGSISACGVQSGNTESSQEMDSEPEEAADPAAQEPAEPAIILDAELKDAVACGIVTEDFFNNSDTAVTFSEFCGMLTNVIEALEPGASEQWNQMAAAAMENGDTMERDDGMLALYEAACVLGMGGTGTAFWNQVDAYYASNGMADKIYSDYAPRDDVFSNCLGTGLFEPNRGQDPDWDYATCAMFYALGQSSANNLQSYFTKCDADVKYSDSLSAEEAVRAAYRLYLAYQSKYEGSFDNDEYAADWSDPQLSDAKKTLDAIINNSDEIKKDSELVMGKTYTGTAYYVSNSGNDESDGKSPSAAWASLEKVEKAPLSYGDAVFFERGGVWHGGLKMQTGVTYSAYGTGAKPVLTGSPADAGQSSKWTLYGSSADGGKIWQYADMVQVCGSILLDGHVLARKAYALWDGQNYMTTDNSKVFTLEEGLFADYMFFSEPDLTGHDLPTEVWQLGLTSPLYFRCDAGNPGDVFDTIEISIVSEATTTAREGTNVIDNLNFRCFATTGMDCCSHDNIVYQNCEVSWCGGAVKGYTPGPFRPLIGVSGGGALLFGTNIVCRNNYIHDCESKGMAVVINGSDSNWTQNTDRFNILAEGNVLERCGNSIYLWTEFLAAEHEHKYEDITFRNNYVINNAYGWRTHSDMWIDSGMGTIGDSRFSVSARDVLATGPVRIESNLFYRSAGILINCTSSDSFAQSVIPTLAGNTYVQDMGQLLFLKRGDNGQGETQCGLAVDDRTMTERCLREFMKDDTGNIVIRQPDL